MAAPVVAVAAVRGVPDETGLELAEGQCAERGGIDVEAHREADVIEAGRRGEGGLGQPHPAPLAVGAEPHTLVELPWGAGGKQSAVS
jgi:hypothetical protein